MPERQKQHRQTNNNIMVKRLKKTLLICFVIYFTALNFSISAEVKKINLDDAIQLSLSNNLDLQAARIEIELAKNNIGIANRLKNPEINFFYNFGRAGRSEPQMLGLSQTLEIAKRASRKKLAKSELLKKELDVKTAEFTLEMDVRETYVDLVSAKTILNDLTEQKEILQELLSLAQKKYKTNKCTQTDIIQAQIALNKLETEINSAKTFLNVRRNDFNKALNIKETDSVIYDAKEDSLPGETVFISLKTPDYNQEMPSFKEIEARALDRRYDIKQAKQAVDIAQKNFSVVARQKIPDIEVMGGYSFLPSTHADSGNFESGAYVGANLTNIPLLYIYKPEIKNAKLQIEQAQINYESVRNKAQKNLNSAYDKFLTSRENLIFYKQKLVKDSEELIKISKKNYSEGKSDLTSVVVMEQSYRDILTGYIMALADYYTDWIDFLREVNTEDFDLSGENL